MENRRGFRQNAARSWPRPFLRIGIQCDSPGRKFPAAGPTIPFSSALPWFVASQIDGRDHRRRTHPATMLAFIIGAGSGLCFFFFFFFFAKRLHGGGQKHRGIVHSHVANVYSIIKPGDRWGSRCGGDYLSSANRSKNAMPSAALCSGMGYYSIPRRRWRPPIILLFSLASSVGALVFPVLHRIRPTCANTMSIEAKCCS